MLLSRDDLDGLLIVVLPPVSLDPAWMHEVCE